MNETIESLSPWFYDFDLGVHGKIESKLPVEVRPIHGTRLEMLNTVVDAYFATHIAENTSCMDIACHEGFYSIQMAQRGLRRVFGIDVRDDSLEKARFVASKLELRNTEFRQMNAEEIRPESVGKFDITLFLGLLYHLENPMLCLRRAASVTKDVCIVETQVIEEVNGVTEWGHREWKHTYQGVLALIDETIEFDAANPETGATPLATCPDRRGLFKMLRHAGFSRIEFIDPPTGAYEQHARGKRVVCAAYK